MSAHSDCGGESAPPTLPTLDPGVHDALSTLYARIMLCQAQWQALCQELDTCRACSAAQRAGREHRRAELARELTALRGQVDRVRREADPAGTFL
jgi:hypothetical protein